MPKINPVFEKRAKKYTELVDTLQPLVMKWIELLDLGKWTISVDYEAEKYEQSPDSWACIRPLWEYQSAHLRLFLPVLAPCTLDELEKTIIHELCHCLVSPMSDLENNRKPEEMVVSTLTRLFSEFNLKIISKTLRKK